MKTPQPIDLMVWVGPGRQFCPILEHSPIETPSGDVTLHGNLSLFISPADVPKSPGLYLVKAMAHVYQKPGYGYQCRLIFEYSLSITGDLARVLAEAQNNGAVDG